MSADVLEAGRGSLAGPVVAVELHPDKMESATSDLKMRFKVSCPFRLSSVNIFPPDMADDGERRLSRTAPRSPQSATLESTIQVKGDLQRSPQNTRYFKRSAHCLDCCSTRRGPGLARDYPIRLRRTLEATGL